MSTIILTDKFYEALSTNLILLILDYLQPEEREGLKNGLLWIIDLLLYQTVMLANRYSVLTITSNDRNEIEKPNVTVEDKKLVVTLPTKDSSQ